MASAPSPRVPVRPARSGLALYGRYASARIRADWQYRTSFYLFLAAQTLVAGTDLATIMVILSSVDALAGWSATEVALLYGISGTAFGMADVVASPVEAAARHIKAGTFDHFLMRPVGTLWQLLGAEFAPRRLGRAVQPAAVLVVAVNLVDVAWTPAAVLLVPLSVLCGAAIYGSVWVITSSLAFWTVETQELANSFTYGGGSLAKYPIDVLGVWLRRAVTFVVPLASVAYLPAAWLLGKPLAFRLPGLVAWTGPLVAVALVLLARVVWGFAVRHYRSTGS